MGNNRISLESKAALFGQEVSRRLSWDGFGHRGYFPPRIRRTQPTSQVNESSVHPAVVHKNGSRARMSVAFEGEYYLPATCGKFSL